LPARARTQPSTPKRNALAAIGLVLLGGALLVLWKGVATRRTGRPNVLLITIDTLRADHVGCYGRVGAATPALDALAARGVRFETAVVHAPITAPSHASLLTGLTPLRHGVRNNGGFALPPDVPTLAEAFRQSGYRTAAFVSGFPLDRRFGLARGFQVYDDRLPHGNDPRRAPYVERPADQTTRAVLAWLDAHATAPETAPFLLWVHYYDPHSPYEPPPDFAARFPGRPYDGEIAFVDSQMGALLRWLDAKGAAQRTLVLATSDHGESLGEHGEQTHGIFVYDTTLRVPWIMAGPGVPAGRVLTTVARGIDLTPTLLDYAAIGARAALDGRSLRPVASGKAMADAPAYAESLFGSLALGWAPLHAWRTARFKLIDAPRPELFALDSDAAEARDLSATQPARVEELRRSLRAAMATDTPLAVAEAGPEVEERLGALGYLGGGRTAPPSAGSLRDPKDGLGLIRRLERGMAEVRSNPALAVQELTAVLDEDAGAAMARRYRAVGLAALGRHVAAIADLKALEAKGELSAEDLIVLADNLRLAGRSAEALDALDRAERLQPQSPLPWLTRANLLLQQGKAEQAAAAYDKVLHMVPEQAEALRGLGDLALLRGDVPAAAGYYDRLLKAAPEDVGALVKLGIVRVRSDRMEEAVALLRQAVARDPKNGEALLYLAGALATSGRGAEAVPLFEQAIAAGQRSTVAFNGLAFTRLELGDGAGAAAAFRQSLALEPRQPQVAAALAQLASRAR
jgi:arylsulfatase A-like enzyme/tetratricopeptide (TPR) repeat protein